MKKTIYYWSPCLNPVGTIISTINSVYGYLAVEGGFKTDLSFGSSFGGGNKYNETKGKWYFYNVQSLGYGKGEFTRIWGNRPLEDKWRRSDKTIINNEKENVLPGSSQPQDLGRQARGLSVIDVMSAGVDCIYQLLDKGPVRYSHYNTCAWSLIPSQIWHGIQPKLAPEVTSIGDTYMAQWKGIFTLTSGDD